MHYFTLYELKNSKEFDFFSIEAEKKLAKGMHNGSYDFFLETVEDKKIGVEILTRPSKGKLKQKLRHYAPETDEFIFVLPSNCLEFYRKNQNNGLHAITRPKCFPKEFASDKIKTWLFDLEKKEFVEKNIFSKIFHVKA